jgi:hypothetical protein
MLSDKCLKNLVTLGGRLQAIADSSATRLSRTAYLKGEFAALPFAIATCDWVAWIA